MRIRYGPGSRTGDVTRTRAPEAALADLNFEVERLLMITEALWGILKEKHGYDDEELIRRINEIDAADGQLDGHVAATPTMVCPTCSRPLAKHRPRCIYCGQAVALDPFAR
jgi:hypothetical protein